MLDRLKSIPRRIIGGILDMPDFAEIEYEGYQIKIRSSDYWRRFINSLGLFDSIPYFESSDIALDVRFSIPKVKNIKDLKDTIAYNWFLCTKNGKRIQPEEGRYYFFNFEGSGVMELGKAKKFKRYQDVEHGDLIWQNHQGRTYFRQCDAIKIGHISEFDHYTIVMQFTMNDGVQSEPKYMGGFTLFDKDVLRHTLFISGIGIIVVAIAAVLLRTCGFPA